MPVPSTSLSPSRPRLFVTTDIGSIEPRVREPDDAQSMVRLLHYANDVEIEGLLASSNMQHGQVCRPELIHTILDAYALAYPALHAHDPSYTTPDDLRATVDAGNPVAGRDVPPEQCVGAAHDTPGSRAIIRAIERDDPRPLWLVVWGGTTDLAQALWRIEQDRSPDHAATLIARLRVIAIADQDATGVWVRAQFPALWYWLRTSGFRGMYRGGHESLVSSAWVQQHIKPAGPLGAIYPDYDSGDIYHRTHGPVHGIKEGDTPSYLGLLPADCNAGLRDQEDPTIGSWSGLATRLPGTTNQFTDAPDPAHPAADRDPTPLASAVYRWRPDFQADFARRAALAKG